MERTWTCGIEQVVYGHAVGRARGVKGRTILRQTGRCCYLPNQSRLRLEPVGELEFLHPQTARDDVQCFVRLIILIDRDIHSSCFC